jgi:hypothetical protein
MKKKCMPKKTPIQTKPIVLSGSRQVVESSIDASKSNRQLSWEASARKARWNSTKQKICYLED